MKLKLEVKNQHTQNTIDKVINFFGFQEKNIDSFRDYSFLLLETK